MVAPLITDIPPLLGLAAVVAVCLHGAAGKLRRPAPLRVGGKVVARGRAHRPTGFIVVGGVALAALVYLGAADLLTVPDGTDGVADAPSLGGRALRWGAVALGYAGLLNALLIAAQLPGRRKRPPSR